MKSARFFPKIISRAKKPLSRYVEARLWAFGPVCPHCGDVDKSGALKGKTTRVGLYKCCACRKPFTVRVGTIFESSHVQAEYLASGDLSALFVQERESALASFNAPSAEA